MVFEAIGARAGSIRRCFSAWQVGLVSVPPPAVAREQNREPQEAELPWKVLASSQDRERAWVGGLQLPLKFD